MSREIKFRAYDKVTKEIYPVERLYFKNGEVTHVGIDCENIKDEFQIIDIKFIELLQYTFLKDVNGKDIYVGDIVKCTELRNENINEWISPVEYDDCDYIVHESKTCDCSLNLFFGGTNKFPLTEIKVIGNIYEKPELLKE
ncbi:MAG: YopX family protein [Clostridium sp.]|uniref:YopX family protein n=1 Tax=Clostridium sp. TaxID=1506 RepID=UPI0025C6DA88|nr:YopX family protein [Clostridium sp.]MCE5221867.1 YopX family protein [Clostridium sp.]